MSCFCWMSSANRERSISQRRTAVCGTEGNVLDAIRENGLTADVIYACGPTSDAPRAQRSMPQRRDIECWISMEERMACGIGACLACVCKSTEKDAHSNVKNKRVCKEGPVFLAEEVEFMMNHGIDLCGVDTEESGYDGIRHVWFRGGVFVSLSI